VKIHNLYWDYSTRSVSEPSEPTKLQATGSWMENPESTHEAQGLVRLAYTSSENADLTRKEYQRADGSTFLTDTTYLDEGKRKRELALYTSSGTAYARFGSASGLYRHWLKSLAGKDRCLAIFDSSFVAKMFGPFKAPNTTKVFMFHSSHIASGEDAMTGKLSKHEPIIEAHEQWDGFVFLTKGQMEAFNARFHLEAKTGFVSNSLKASALEDFPASSNPRKLIAVGRLTKLKRFDHAIRVLDELLRSNMRATLDIVGDGPELNNLIQLANDLGVGEYVNFLGHRDDVPRLLAEHGILLMNSKSEGQGLVLLEAQYQRCIPVAYDVPFGPASIITGKNGVLVPDGDVRRMADEVGKLIRNPLRRRLLATMAGRSARHYASQSVTAQWDQVVEGLS